MAFRLAALLRGSAMGLGDVTVDSAKRWRRHAVRLLTAEGEALPKTQPGRRLDAATFLEQTDRMRGLKPRAIAANDIF